MRHEKASSSFYCTNITGNSTRRAMSPLLFILVGNFIYAVISQRADTTKRKPLNQIGKICVAKYSCNKHLAQFVFVQPKNLPVLEHCETCFLDVTSLMILNNKYKCLSALRGHYTTQLVGSNYKGGRGPKLGMRAHNRRAITQLVITRLAITQARLTKLGPTSWIV